VGFDVSSPRRFLVATIRPSQSDEANLHAISMGSRLFSMKNASVSDMIAFAYRLNPSQIIGAPKWVDRDRFDIDAVPDEEKVLPVPTIREMMKSLLSERFGLEFHEDQKPMSAYVIRDSDALKMSPDKDTDKQIPAYKIVANRSGVTLGADHVSLSDFATFLQMMVLDKPVLYKGSEMQKYSLSLTFLPDGDQFHGHPPVRVEDLDPSSESGNIFTEMRQQLGLRLKVQRIETPVMVVTDLHQPSGN
jgi:uncharacterized protein (TIGR03435 family)